jgi:chromatin segregation and condensation protein Rec8/ScpA/Scc1 (kleisin family)
MRLALAELFAGRKRGEMIGLFLATLELVRRRAVRVRQEAPGMPIELELRPEEDRAEASGAAAPEVVVVKTEGAPDGASERE